jgi:hypothetical protein
MRKTPHSINEVIQAAGEAKKEARYGAAIHIRIATPPNVNKTAPHNLRWRSAAFCIASLAWKRAEKPVAGETFFTVRKAFPVSASALQYEHVRMCVSSSSFCLGLISLSFNNQSSKGW